MGSFYHDPRPLHPRHLAPVAKGRLRSLHSLIDLRSATWLQLTQDSPWKVKYMEVTTDKYTASIWKTNSDNFYLARMPHLNVCSLSTS